MKFNIKVIEIIYIYIYILLDLTGEYTETGNYLWKRPYTVCTRPNHRLAHNMYVHNSVHLFAYTLLCIPQ